MRILLGPSRLWTREWLVGGGGGGHNSARWFHYNRARTTRPDIDPEKFDSDPSQETGYKRNWLQDYVRKVLPEALT